MPTKGKMKMFWACFTWGRTDLVVINGDSESPKGDVIAKRYIKTLKEYLPTILEPNSIFMHDNAFIHSMHKVWDWLRNKALEVID